MAETERRPARGGTPQPTAAQVRALEGTRRTFLANLYGNANFYGTVPELELPVAFPLAGNTFWEELTCVGLNPELARLEAVVLIKRTSGYSGDLCSVGSTEYVRFFVDWQDGTGFHDAGTTSFQAFDIPDTPGVEHPLHYVVTVQLDAANHQRCCTDPLLPRVRAILGWNHLPTGPGDRPPFGNAHDADTQLLPGQCSLVDLFSAEAIVAAALPATIDTSAPLTVHPPAPAAWHTLAAHYRRTNVPAHRMVYEMVQPLLGGGRATMFGGAQPDAGELAALEINLAEVIAVLANPQGNTSFEELICAGLTTATDTLGAVIHIKRPTGYSGTLCHAGSLEYVAFWADWDQDGVYDEYLGTASVTVHDIAPLPADGLFYSVTLPVPQIAEHLRACADPNIVRIRAVLSWATPPSTTDPNALDFWGNRLDVLVQLRPGVPMPPGTLYDLLYSVGRVPIPNISTTTFLAYPSSGVLNAANCGQAIQDRPFGGLVQIAGRIYNSGAPGTVQYRVEYSPHGAGSWTPVSADPLTLTLAHPNPADPKYPHEVKTITPAGGYYPYSEDWSVSPPILEENALLAWWNTGTLAGAFDLRLRYTTDFVTFHTSAVVTIMVNNVSYTVSPTANAAIDFSATVDLIIVGGDCHSYTQGEVFTGELRAVHPYFAAWSLDLQPSTHTHGTQASPHCRSYGSLIDAGDATATWHLDTSHLDRCGYTVTLTAYDRRIVDSNGNVPYVQKAVGFAVI